MTLYVIGTFFLALAARDRVKGLGGKMIRDKNPKKKNLVTLMKRRLLRPLSLRGYH
jgi:hypothetical protein